MAGKLGCPSDLLRCKHSYLESSTTYSNPYFQTLSNVPACSTGEKHPYFFIERFFVRFQVASKSLALQGSSCLICDEV